MSIDVNIGTKYSPLAMWIVVASQQSLKRNIATEKYAPLLVSPYLR